MMLRWVQMTTLDLKGDFTVGALETEMHQQIFMRILLLSGIRKRHEYIIFGICDLMSAFKHEYICCSRLLF